MRRAWIIAAAVCLAAPVAAQSPDTDVYVAALSWRGDSLIVSGARNATSRAGYDNQPSFTPDSRTLLYTVQADGQTDIWAMDLGGMAPRRVTSTPESEYSATVMPVGRRFSVIRVERDSTQRLWSFAMNGRDPRLVLTRQRPVGYHTWITPSSLATYVLGTPSTLHLVSTDEHRDTVVAHDIGRALAMSPGGKGLFFTQRDSARRLVLMSMRTGGGHPLPLAVMPADNEFIAVMPNGRVLSASEGWLVEWNGGPGATNGWRRLAPLADATRHNVSRLAVSPDGRWLAFVAEAGPGR